jgi:sugar phosphate isomerase/epimerase
MFWGVKSHWTDFWWSKDLAHGMEMHQNPEDLFDLFDEQIAEISALGRSTAVHVPQRVDGNMFGLSNGKELEFAVKCSELGKLVVVHGDATKEGFIDRVAELVSRTKSVIAVENRPGIRYKQHKLTYAKDFAKLFSEFDHKRLGITLDIAHIYMGSNPEDTLRCFFDDLSDKIRHIHIVDADGKEERQIGYGIVDFNLVFDGLSEIKRDIMVIPEVPGGQMSKGAGFKHAIRTLRHYPINRLPEDPSSWP